VGLYLYRLMGAATLDASMYEGVEADRQANSQAALTVVLSSVASGVGAGGLYGLSAGTFVAMTVIALVTWVAWAVLMFQIGTRLLPEAATRATLGELLRTTGFAAAPGMLQVFGLLPRMAVPVYLATIVWMIAAMVIAVRHALDYQSTWRALAVCGVAAALSLVLAFGLGLVFGPTLS
jgi:Yip1 domain